ncbi:MAG: hypothetical protein ABL921_19050 [Pirellula sp.]
MSLRIARTARQSVSLRKAGLSCLTGVGLAFVGQSAIGQENSLRFSFLQNPASGAALEKRQENSTEVLKIKLLDPPASRSGSGKGEDTDPDTSKQDKSPTRPEPAFPKPADETKREQIVLPGLVIPNTSTKKGGEGTMPDDMVAGRLPPPMNLPFGPDRKGNWTMEKKNWTAPVYCHQPTYFHDSMLEEHGHERFPSMTPLISGVRFYSQIAFLPYLSYLNPPLKDISSAGHFRPGTAAPCLRQRAPYDPGALRFQLLTTGTTVLAGQP